MNFFPGFYLTDCMLGVLLAPRYSIFNPEAHHATKKNNDVHSSPDKTLKFDDNIFKKILDPLKSTKLVNGGGAT